MFCGNCGVKVNDNGAFCTQCGNPTNQLVTPNNVNTDETQNLQQSEYKQVAYNCQEDGNKINYSAKNDSLVPLIIVLCIVAIGSACAILYMLNKTYIKPTTTYSNIGETAESEMQKSKETNNSNSATSAEDSSSSSNVQLDNENVINPTYLTYNDSIFKLSCAYPSHFTKFENINEGDLLLLSSPNKTEKMSICATSNSLTLSAKEAMLKYINSVGGNVEYQDNGDTWYAASITVGDMKYYRKCFVDDKYIRWFDFNYPSRYNDIYPKYIEYIEKNFKIQ